MNRAAKVFLLTNTDDLSIMQETPYDMEDVLQGLLARYPDLLPGEQINPDEPRRWLLIRREMGVPGEEGAEGRWSLDHLFVDQDGIPTLVECKRALDTRLRRTVVAQMLDYAANATEYWPMDKLRQSAAETAERRGADLDADVLSMLDSQDPESIEPFWQTVEQNLRMGRLRLIFVSDSIPRELRRIVEYLNEQMDRTEVLAVELKQFTDGEATVMAPRVLGTTEMTRQRKESLDPTSHRTRSRPWTIEEYTQHIQSSEFEIKTKSLVQRILVLARQWEQEGILSLEGGRGKNPQFMLKVERSILILTAVGSMRIYAPWWQLPEDITEEFLLELSCLLGNSREVLKEKEPDIAPLLHEWDPELTKFAPWLRKVASEIQKHLAADQETP